MTNNYELAKETPKVECVVLGYGQFEALTRKCLESLLAQCAIRRVGVTVVDNGSNDGSDALLRKFSETHKNLKTIFLRDNLGYGGAMTYASKTINTDWLILITNDVIFPSSSLAALLDGITLAEGTNANYDILAPLSNNAGTGQCVKFDANELERMLTEMSKFIGKKLKLLTEIYRADFCCVAIRKSVWDRLGGFDSSYGKGYFEDFDFCMRAKNFSSRCGVIEGAVVYHAGSQTLKPSDQQRALIKRNKALIKSKFPGLLLEHRREENFRILNSYVSYYTNGNLRGPIMALSKLRFAQLLNDLPKSFFKKIIWKHRLSKLASSFQRICGCSLDSNST